MDTLNPEQLGPCLSQIVVSLVGCFHANSSIKVHANAKAKRSASCEGTSASHQDVLVQIASLLERLCVPESSRYKELLQPYFAELPVLPSHDLLKRVSEGLKASAVSVPVVDRVKYAVRSMDHESPNVRATALAHLREVLQNHLSTLRDHFLQDPCDAASLVTALLDRCSDSSEVVRVTTAECIGRLGALDPALIGSINNIKRNSQRRFTTSEDFIIALIKGPLHRVVRGSSASAQNRVWHVFAMVPFPYI